MFEVLTIAVLIASASYLILINIHRSKSAKLNNGTVLVTIDHNTPKDSNLKIFSKQLTQISIDSNYLYEFQQWTADRQYSSLDESYYVTAGRLQKLKSYIDSLHDSIKVAGIERTAPLNNIDITKTKQVSKLKRKLIGKIENTGDVAFCLEDSMKINESYKALLIISRKVNSHYIKQIQERGFPEGIPKVTNTTMLLANKIFANLQPALAHQFSIVRADLDTVKTIDLQNKDYIAWEWVITPLKVGLSNLILTLSRVDIPKGDTDKFIPTKVIPVQVYAERKSKMDRIGEFISAEWKFILMTFFGGLGWILVYQLKRKESRK